MISSEIQSEIKREVTIPADEQTEVIESPRKDRNPIKGEVSIEKPNQRITGDIAMCEANGSQEDEIEG